jgi:hypothetical protein
MFEIKQQDKTEFFINELNEVSITQEDFNSQENNVIVITYENLNYAIKSLKALKKELYLTRKDLGHDS